MNFFYWIQNMFEECEKLEKLEKENETEMHMIPFQYEVSKEYGTRHINMSIKNYHPFTKKRKSVSWSAGDRVGMTFSNDEYDRSIDRFQIKNNMFLCLVLKKG